MDKLSRIFGKYIRCSKSNHKYKIIPNEETLIDVLNNDVLFLIFTFIPLTNIINILLTCKKWRDILKLKERRYCEQILREKFLIVVNLKPYRLSYSYVDVCIKLSDRSVVDYPKELPQNIQRSDVVTLCSCFHRPNCKSFYTPHSQMLVARKGKLVHMTTVYGPDMSSCHFLIPVASYINKSPLKKVLVSLPSGMVVTNIVSKFTLHYGNHIRGIFDSAKIKVVTISNGAQVFFVGSDYLFQLSYWKDTEEQLSGNGCTVNFDLVTHVTELREDDSVIISLNKIIEQDHPDVFILKYSENVENNLSIVRSAYINEILRNTAIHKGVHITEYHTKMNDVQSPHPLLEKFDNADSPPQTFKFYNIVDTTVIDARTKVNTRTLKKVYEMNECKNNIAKALLNRK